MPLNVNFFAVICYCVESVTNNTESSVLRVYITHILFVSIQEELQFHIIYCPFGRHDSYMHTALPLLSRATYRPLDGQGCQNHLMCGGGTPWDVQ